LPFSDRAFDLVWASNVTSFISDKGLAIREYLRMLAPGGFLVLVPIYYRTTPPDTLVRRIGDAIGTSLRVWKKHDWTAFCDAAATDAGDVVELVFSSDFDYVDRTDAIDAYCADVLAKPHLRSLSPEAYTAVVARYKNVIRLFQENLVYCGFSILLYQRRSVREEAELFLSHPISCDD
jgi:SAM-dependent methyltransferase